MPRVHDVKDHSNTFTLRGKYTLPSGEQKHVHFDATSDAIICAYRDREHDQSMVLALSSPPDLLKLTSAIVASTVKALGPAALALIIIEAQDKIASGPDTEQFID